MRSSTTLFSSLALTLPLGLTFLFPGGSTEPTNALTNEPTNALNGPANTAAASTPAPVRHCQIPCGIYGDKMRISMLMEDAATIEKGMKMLAEFDKEESPSKNQIVRWVMNKDTHAQAIQDQVAAYWLAQRIKAPKEGSKDKYHKQLELMHGITVAAMKCKQTADTAHVDKMKKLAIEFSGTYFSKEDLEHIMSHHGH